MPGVQGKPIPARMKTFILEAARDDPSRTNSDIKKLTEETFEWSPDASTISKFRREAGIPSSRNAAGEVSTIASLPSDQQNYAQKLLYKLVLPHPDHLRLTEMIIGVGGGSIGPPDKQIHIRLNRLELAECWLSAMELKWLMNALAKVPDLQARFLSLFEQGLDIVNDILGHNRAIALGNGESSFGEMLQLLDGTTTDSPGQFEQAAYQLWNQYTAFGKELAEFKRRFEESQLIHRSSART